MTIQQQIEEKLIVALGPLHIEVVNESANHNVPPGSESHFKVVLVAEEFDNKRLIQRHQRVNKILADELKNSIHALALHTYTQSEWQEKFASAPMSPRCHGGSSSSSDQ